MHTDGEMLKAESEKAQMARRDSWIGRWQVRRSFQLSIFQLSTFGALCLCGLVVQPVRAAEPTYSRDVAPIMFDHCASCHRTGGDGPFPLITYDDVKKRARQISVVTQSRFMPPWLPSRGHESCAELVGQRGLSDDQIALIETWVDAGAPQGDPELTPQPPEFKRGWQLGEPDLILTLPEPYIVPAAGSDLLRSFVIPINLDENKYVTAIEFRPLNPRAIHHAAFLIDTTGTGRMLDDADPGPGYRGMADIGLTQAGSFGGWASGTPVTALPAGVSRTLPARCDFGMNVHFNATGKPEPQQFEVGLHFADNAQDSCPPRELQAITLGNYAFDVPANETRQAVSDEFVLPVDVQVIGLSPHAHYLCTRMSITATRPDGTHTCLLRIDDWDFNWQQPYQFKEGIPLPAGTRVRMEFDYDNTAANARNPRNPPADVRVGHDITDEMALTFLSVTVVRPEDAAKLDEAHRKKQIERLEAAGEWAVRNAK